MVEGKGVVKEVVDDDDDERMNWKEVATKRRPRIITGIESKRIRRRPMRSMRIIATRVKMKFVMATVSEVRVGEAKPRREKIVAEKYMREFWIFISTSLRDLAGFRGRLRNHIAAANPEASRRSLKHGDGLYCRTDLPIGIEVSPTSDTELCLAHW